MTIPSLLTDMQKMLKAYEKIIGTWVSAEGSLDDPYETEYRENYAPANAAVILAYLCRFSNTPGNDNAKQLQELLRKMIARSLELLQDRNQVNPFCRVFLYHYSLMAMLVAPEHERELLLSEYSDAFAKYVDDCDVINTNCSALQWAMELFTELLDIRKADRSLLDHRLAFISSAQLSSGFINDEVDSSGAKDGMPIAYHAFTLFILNSALSLIRHWPQALLEQKQKAESIVDRGMGWLEHAVSLDGTMAMVGRSSHQMFTWGALVALVAGRLVRQEKKQSKEGGHHLYTSSLLEKAFTYWLPFKQADGTYSCTPNHWPHALRVGYESYTHLNMYNLLGLTGIVIAAEALGEHAGNGGSSLEELAELPAGDPSEVWMDTESGYAFYRSGGQFFGCTLRMHHRQYAPAMQVFHVRLENQSLPLAEARLPGLGTTAVSANEDGIWEGFVVEDSTGQLYYPDSRSNVEAVPLPDGLELSVETNILQCVKAIRITKQGIEWTYTLKTNIALNRVEQVVPLIVHNGRHALTYSKAEKTYLECIYAGKRYSLYSEGAAEIQVDLKRSILSPSGVSSKARIKMSAPLAAGEAVKWTTKLEIVRATS
ncbi:hypothetical protein [Paenibacillus senegalensis]|uniref:hypothetical protein n=1 Tax=Paenibacillus senegalensis TaxID=1465766 RepID=UPI0002889D76|nr:hypothetical protein [Paenibacillus senegalensis]